MVCFECLLCVRPSPEHFDHNTKYYSIHKGLPCSSVSKESACSAEDLSSIPGSGRSPGEGNGNPLQDSYLENPMDRGAWQLQELDTT